MNTISADLIGRISQSVLAALQSDLVSHGELREIASENITAGIDLAVCMGAVLAQLLNEDVQIGYALNVEGRYVKFVAWQRSVGKRVNRARHEVELSRQSERDFAFWLCLSKNVDEYESGPVHGEAS